MVIPIVNNNAAEELSFASSSLSNKNFNKNNSNHSYFSSSVNTVRSNTSVNSSTLSPMRSFSSAYGGLYISAPGKIILFGEHAVVYGRTAIAGSIDLRTYVSLFTSADGRIYLSLPDMDVEKTWMLKDLQKACERLAIEYPIEEGPPSLDLIVPIARKLSGACEDQCGVQNLAILAFWYLLIGVIQKKKDLLAVKVTVRFKLPPCVGLGSSGAFCVCIATALLQTAGLIPPPTIPTNFDGSLTWDECHLEVIRKWSAAAESLIHGRASGLDAAVCTYGGVASYKPGKKIENLENIPNLKVILVNSKVERNTSRMVQNVKDKLNKFPHVIDNIFNAIDEISLAAAKILQQKFLPNETGIDIIENGERSSTLTPLFEANNAAIIDLSDSNNLQLTLNNNKSSSLNCDIAKGKRNSTVSAVSCASTCDFRTKLERNELTEIFEKLNDLSRINNQLLISLGVGHAKIDQICILLGRYGIYPKMTGAGGGGSVFAFLKPDISQTILSMIREELKKEGYEMWQPLLGGPGVMCHTQKPDLFNFVNNNLSVPHNNIVCNNLLISRSNTPSSSSSNIRNKKN